MPKEDRLEQHLMRQRGTGSHKLQPSFAFTFTDAARAAFVKRQKVTTPARKTPSRRGKSPAHNSLPRKAHATTVARTPSERAPSPAKLSIPKSASRTRASAKKAPVDGKPFPLPPAEEEDDHAPPVQSPVRKAKFYEHLSDEEPTQKTKLKKAAAAKKTTTRRKRKPVTMPRPGRKKATAAKSKPSQPDDIPEDPADIVVDDDHRSDAERDDLEIKTPHGSMKRRQARPADPAATGTHGQDTKRQRRAAQDPDRYAPEPQQLPSPVASDEFKDARHEPPPPPLPPPPKTKMQRLLQVSSRLFARRGEEPAGALDDNDDDDGSLAPSSSSSSSSSSSVATAVKRSLSRPRSSAAAGSMAPPVPSRDPARGKGTTTRTTGSVEVPGGRAGRGLLLSEDEPAGRPFGSSTGGGGSRPSSSSRSATGTVVTAAAAAAAATRPGRRRVLLKADDDNDNDVSWFTRRKKKATTTKTTT